MSLDKVIPRCHTQVWNRRRGSGASVVSQEVVVDEDLPSLPKNMQARVIRAIEERLATAPDQYGNRLRKSLMGLWRLRVGDYRIIYEIEGQNVLVWAIGHRRVAYDAIQRRWPPPEAS